MKQIKYDDPAPDDKEEKANKPIDSHIQADETAKPEVTARKKGNTENTSMDHADELLMEVLKQVIYSEESIQHSVILKSKVILQQNITRLQEKITQMTQGKDNKVKIFRSIWDQYELEGNEKRIVMATVINEGIQQLHETIQTMQKDLSSYTLALERLDKQYGANNMSGSTFGAGLL